MKILITEKLEQLLQSKWTDFIDKQQLIRLCLESARDAGYKTVKQKEIPPTRLLLSITSFKITNDPDFEIWVEFSIPKDEGVIIGTHVFSLSLMGNIELKETYGANFVIGTSC